MSYSDVECVNSEPWVTPAPEHFNTVHDCSLFARYLSLMLRYDVQFNLLDQLDHYDRLAQQEHKLCRVPIIVTENFVLDSLPLELRPSSCELIRWYYGNGSLCTEAQYLPTVQNDNVWNPYIQKLIYEPRVACNKELRSALGLAGNPDIAGIGVMISYCIEVILVTMYLVLIVASKLEQRCPNGKLKSLMSKPISKKLLNAFEGSIQALFSSAMIFSFAMVLATLTTFSYRLDRSEVEERWMNGDEVSLYEPQLLVTASTFSMFPVIVLHFSVHSRLSGMRRRMKTVLVLLLYGLCSASIVWLCASYFEPGWRAPFWFDTEPDIFLSDFVYNHYNIYAGILFSLVVAVPALGGIIALVLMLWYRQAKWPHEQHWWKPPPRYIILWQYMIPIFCFLMMWVSTFILFYLRNEAIRDSGTDSTSEWTVGQVLALANWGPVIVEFLYLSCFGPAPDKDEESGMKGEGANPGSACATKPTAIVVPMRIERQDTFDTCYSGETMRYDPDVMTSPIWQWRNTLCTL